MSKSKGASLETVIKAVGSVQKTVTLLTNAVVSLQEQVSELPTKNDVERIVEQRIDEAFKTNEQLKKIDEIAKDVKALSKAVDKDAVTIVNHGKRIIKIEQHLAIK